MFVIRHYEVSDYPMIQSWWTEQNEAAPTEDMLPEESTFVLEIDGHPAVSASVLMTNCSGVALFENLIANPALKGNRRSGTKALVDFAAEYARAMGFKRMFSFAYKEKVADYCDAYLNLKRTKTNVHSLVREL